MAREDFSLSYPIRVRWAEVDPQSVVFNANYLVYFDVGATEYWRALGFVYPSGFAKHAIDMFAVKATVEYHKPARYDDEIDVLTRVSKIGRTSLRLALEIHRGADHLISGELVYVVTDLTGPTPTPVPQVLRDAIAGYEKLPPEM